MKVIQDEDQLKKFIGILPDLTKHERYYFHLQARKKYTDKLKNADKVRPALQRWDCGKEDIINKLRRLELPDDVYKTKDGEVVPVECLAVYMTPNPRCMLKASFSTIREITHQLERAINNDHVVNPVSIALHNMHLSKSRSCFVHFDLDGDLDLKNVKEKLDTIVGAAYHLIQTRGGAHVLVKPELTPKKNWFLEIKKELDVDQVGDLMTPIPGTIQGGFIPKLYD